MIELYTASTPNGWKISVMLEELGLPYEVHPVDLTSGEQKQPEFLALNPNGRIPAIVDRESNVTLAESGAIMLYLAEKTDQLIPKDLQQRYQVVQWLMFQMSGVGPMQGQANVFYRYFPEKIPAAIERYQHETARLYGVLNDQLQQQEYLVGEYSIADIANWCWVSIAAWAGIDLAPFPHLQRWVDQIAARPAVQRGIAIPYPANFTEMVEDEAERQRVAKIGQSMLTR